MANPQTQKRIFKIVSILFVLLMIYFTIDFLSRTTRPGGRGQLKERIQKRLENDSLPVNSTRQ
jgi:dolichyl-phosphate-mannose--protein O-mannosyl transferase